MPSINVVGSAARMLAFKTNTPNQCLNYVWQAIAQGKYHYITGGAANAYATWVAVPEANKHHADRNVPKDMPAFLGPRAGSAAGDVIISRGDGTFVATDYPHSGVISICTLQQRITQTGRPYAGWADSMGGYNLTGSTTASGGATPITPTIASGDDMLRFMNNPANKFGIGDESHWQEIDYQNSPDTSKLGTTTADLIAIRPFMQEVAFDQGQWNARSNGPKALNRPVFTIGADGHLLPINSTSSSSTVDVAALAGALLAQGVLTEQDLVAALSALKIPTAAQNGAAARTAIVAAQ